MVWRKVALWLGAVTATIALIVLGAMTALWLSVGGTFFRGERVTAGTVFQMGVAVASCVALFYLVRFMIRAASRT